jgi:hypothetical protein
MTTDVRRPRETTKTPDHDGDAMLVLQYAVAVIALIGAIALSLAGR